MNCGLHSEVDAPGTLGCGFFVPIAWALLQPEFSVDILRRCRASRADNATEDELWALAEQAAARNFRNFTAEAP
jgi:hypothetical protein